MKKQLRTHPALKALAVILALVLGAGGFWASLFTLSQWDDIWTGTGYYESSNCYSNLYNRLAQVRELAWLMQNRTWDGSLSYLDQQRLEALQEALSPEQTNFRFRLVDNATGEPVYGNLPGGQTMEGAVYRVLSDSLELQRYNGGHEDDYQTWDQEMDYYQLHIIQSDGSTLLFLPEEESVANQYGWLFNGSSWDYYEELDRRVLSRVLAVEYGVTNPQTVTDEFTEGAQDYLEYAQYLPGVALLSLALDVLTVLLVVFLCLGAGRRRDREGVLLNHFDRIPLDLLIFLEFWALAALLALGDSMAWALNSGALNLETAVGLGVLSLGISGCLLAFLLTLATRIKTRTVFSNTLTWLLCRAIGRLCRALGRSWPLTWRVVVLFLLYLLGSVLTALTVFLIPVYQGLALYFLCRWTIQWRRVREGAARIVGGDPSCKIDTGGKMYPDLREHAEQLNDLGGAIRTAVDRQLKSERFKAELITNVSHDLKTPLTSIINYVDLLKKEEIQNPRAAEYIEVLDRKSQRLKKLTEDLVEAS
ncbi:ATP-binding protein, partial [Lawsonibacter sp.]